jgi:hypothetical protein
MPRTSVLLLIMGLASGCASNLQGSNLYTSTIFFLPPSSANTVYIEARNTSDNQQVTLNDLGSRLSAKGYKVVTDPNQAQYVIQANTVYCNTEKQTITMETMVAGGYGGGIGSAISSFGGAIGNVGSMAGMANPMIGMGAAGISAAAGALGSAVDSIGSMFGSSGPEVKTKENITYACVTDVQITERPSSPGAMQPGGPKVYQTRLVAGVHQKKLDAQEATPLLQQKLSASVAGNF